MIMLFYSLAFVCFIANIVYTFKIIINSIKKRETENFQVKMFWGTLIAVWGLAGLGFVIDNDVRLGFTSFAMIPFSCLFPCLIRLVYIYVKKESGLKKKWWALTIICFVTILPIYSIGENLEPDDVKQARIEKEAQVRKAEKERKAAEEQAAIEKNKQEQEKEISQKLQDMNEEEIALYKNKYQEYSSIMGDAEAKLKAVKDVEENTKKKKQELQDLYDKQEQYEEWIAWQKAEEEKKISEQQRNDAEDKSVSKNETVDGWWGKVKSTASDLASQGIDYAGQVSNDEVVINELSSNELLVYYKPSSRKNIEEGLIFKDRGYAVEVIAKAKVDITSKNGKVIKKDQYLYDRWYEFMKKDNYMKWRYQGDSGWNTLHESDEANIIYEKTK